MSDEKHIKQAIIASLCEHPEAAKYQRRAFDNPEKVMEAMAQGVRALTKADFFTPDDDGKLLIDSTGGWYNFDKIVKIVHAGGDKFTYEDFLRPLTPDSKRTLLESARVHGALDCIFKLNIWQGRFEEMERLWYKVEIPLRREIFRNDGFISLDLKRAMFAAEGRITPEDRLAKAGFSPKDVYDAFGPRGNIEELNRRLQLAGDYLRKEYVLMTDVSGDTVFDFRSSAWDKYDACVRILLENGERFEVSDYLKQVSHAKSILGRAAERDALKKVFNPEYWVDHLPEMLTLWSRVLDGWQSSEMSTREFDNVYAEAESLTYTRRFQGMAVTSKADLLTPMNADDGNEKPVLALGLKAVWDKFDAVQEQLAKGGEAVTVADLRAPTGQLEDTCLIRAVKYGHFDKIIQLSKQSGQLITMDDFLSKDRHGMTLLSILAEKKELALAFAPDLWVGRVPEMKVLWDEVTVSQRAQLDFRQAEVAAKQATLKKKGGGFKFQSRTK